ncbi:MAG: hypothetical protein J6T69_03130, partial [Methanobrevibacter sp.]|nr:hypothetical protein [Methanobrevibacter sp.]
MHKKLFILSILFLVVLSISAVEAMELADNSTVGQENASQLLGAGLETNSSASADVKYVSSSKVKSVNLKTSKVSTTYGSGKYLIVKAIDAKTKKPVNNLKINLKFYTGKKYKIITKKTNASGVVKCSVSTLGIGSHKVIVKLKSTKIKSKSIKTYVKISKAKITISAPKTTNYFNESKKFNITIKNKESKKVMKNIKVNVKVYTGKKYKSYSLKTNKYGVVSFNTKSLSKGAHKVTVNVKSSSKVKAASKN